MGEKQELLGLATDRLCMVHGIEAQPWTLINEGGSGKKACMSSIPVKVEPLAST